MRVPAQLEDPLDIFSGERSSLPLPVSGTRELRLKAPVLGKWPLTQRALRGLFILAHIRRSTAKGCGGKVGKATCAAVWRAVDDKVRQAWVWHRAKGLTAGSVLSGVALCPR
jgi:hypothetical protein